MSLHHLPFLMWCNDSESRGHPGNQVHIYQVPLDSFSGALFLNVKHTWRAFTRPETNTCYGNNLDNSWIVLLEECRQLQKYFTLFKDLCSALCHSKCMYTSCSCLIAPLLHSPGAPVEDQSSVQAYLMVTRSSPLLCYPGQSGHTEVCYKWWKDWPLTLFHVKHKHLSTAFKWKLWQWNIPGDKHDISVWKRSFAVTWILLPLYMIAQVISACCVLGQRQRKQLCQTVSSLWVSFLQVLPVQR